MNRLVIIGPPGSGKTTLAGTISGIKGLPVIQVDSLRFDSDGELVSQEKFDSDTAEVISADRWIVEGNHRSTLPQRCRQADEVIILDLPRRICWWRAVKRDLFPPRRWMRNPIRGVRVLWIWPPIKMPDLREIAQSNSNGEKLFHFHSQSDVDRFVECLRGGE